MTTVKRLFLHRFVSDWKYQYSLWKTVVDWVVALYIVIPFGALFVHTYINWWGAIPPVLNYIPFDVFLFLLIPFSWSGTFRIFVEEADQIFLFQRSTWMRKLTQYSMVYYLGTSLVLTSLFFAVLAPFFVVHYGLTGELFFWLLFTAFCSKVSLGILKQLIEFRFQGLMKIVTKGGAFAAFSIFFLYMGTSIIAKSLSFWIMSIFLFLLMVFLIAKRLTLKGTLLKDIEVNSGVKLRFANVLLKVAGSYKKKPVILRTRPWLFRNSNSIFKKRTPENGLVELCLKATLRRRSNMVFYLQVLGAYALFLSIFPGTWKWVLWGVSILFFISMVKLYWLELIRSPFVSMFSLPSETKENAAARSLFIMALPAEIVLAVCVVLQTQDWLYALILLPLGFIVSKVIAKMFVMFS